MHRQELNAPPGLHVEVDEWRGLGLVGTRFAEDYPVFGPVRVLCGTIVKRMFLEAFSSGQGMDDILEDAPLVGRQRIQMYMVCTRPTLESNILHDLSRRQD